MNKKILQESLETSAGGAFVSIADIARWAGRSREFIIKTLRDVECYKTGKHALYFSGDVAEVFAKEARPRKRR